MTPPTPWGWHPQRPSLLEQPLQFLHLSGADTRRFLHGQTSAAIDTAAPGTWVPTCCISPTGRMQAVAEVLVEENGAWLLVRAGEGARVRAALDRVLFPADQVSLGDLETGRWLTPLDGPPASTAGTPATLTAAAGEGGERRWQALPDGQGWRLGGSWALRDGAPLPAELAGRSLLSDAEQERWRLQQGEPGAPAEVNEETNPFELGLADRVSLSKGCYVGQETLAKLATYDGVKQQLRRWHAAWPQASQAEAPAEPQPGSVLVDAGGRRAGRITSALRLADGTRIGLALVRRQALEATALHLEDAPEGAPLTISTAEGFVPPPVGGGSQTR